MELLEGTRERLRDSAIAAMGLKQDDVAAQLLEILNAKTIDLNADAPAGPPPRPEPTQVVLGLPDLSLPAPPVTARGTAEWATLLEAEYLPKLRSAGVVVFTSREALAWAEQYVSLSAGDRGVSGGRIRWRCRVSDALALLRERGRLARVPGVKQSYQLSSPPPN